MALEPKFIAPTFTAISSRFEYDPQLSDDEQLDTMRQVFHMPPMDNATLEQILSAGISQFNLNDVLWKSSERAKREALSKQAQERIFQECLRIGKGKHWLDHADDKILGIVGRKVSFLQFDGSEAADKANQKFLEECVDPKKLAQNFYNGIMQSMDALGIESTEDVSDLYEISDEDLVARYDKISLFCRRVAEMQGFENSPHLTAEQQNVVRSYIGLAMSLTQVMENRMNMIANPFYAVLDPNRLPETISATDIEGVMDKMADEGVNFGKDVAGLHALASLPTSISTYVNQRGAAMMDRLAAVYPNLKFSDFSADPEDTLSSSRVVVARTPDGKEMVLTNSKHLQYQTDGEYIKQLSDQAIKADKWLLTGSKQFANMQKALKALNDLQNNPNATAQEKEELSKALADAAKAYLVHKNIKVGDPFNPDNLLHKGKNQREQTRLETAAAFLDYGRGKSALAEKVAAKEKEMAAKPEEPKKEEPKPEKKVQPKPQVKEEPEEALTDEFRKMAFIENVRDNAKGIMTYAPTPERDMTRDEVKKKAEAAKKTSEQIEAELAKYNPEKPPTTPIMEQDQFTLLCALACGSDLVTIKLPSVKRDGNGKAMRDAKGFPISEGEPKIVKNQPDMTYGNVMRQMQGKEPQFSGATAKEVKTEKAIYQGFVRNAQRLVYNALKSGNINALAQILADGLKQNNKLLQQEKGITRGFCAYADIGGQVMDLMEKYPAIKTAVQKQNLLTPDDLSIAKAGKAISDVHTKGLTAQKELLNRFVQRDREDEFIKDVEPKLAAVCQMYGVNKQIGGKKLNLATCPYGKIPNFDQQLNKTLAGNEPMVGFLKEFAKKEQADMVNIIRNPEQMAKLYQQGIENTLQREEQQNAATPKLNVAQNERKQEQIKGAGMN